VGRANIENAEQPQQACIPHQSSPTGSGTTAPGLGTHSGVQAALEHRVRSKKNYIVISKNIRIHGFIPHGAP
jgi:hypothetical protein